MVDVGQTGVEDPFAVVVAEPPSQLARLSRLAILVVVAVIVVAIVAWQFLALHSDINNVKSTDRHQTQTITQLNQTVAGYQNSVTATLSCLESPQTQKSLCTQFLK
jgi:predicted PurR-regulated permease PerM